MQVELSRPELIASLVEALRRAECVCTQTAANRFAVYHQTAADAREASIELTFFLRAWQRQHEPVEIRLVA